MKRFKLFNAFLSCLLSVLILSTIGADSAFARWIDYSFVNYSGRIIKYLYITATGYDSWGSDILGSSVLGNGDRVGLRYNDDYRYYDVKVVFSDGSDVVFGGHDYRSLWRLTIFHKGGNTYTISSN